MTRTDDRMKSQKDSMQKKRDKQLQEDIANKNAGIEKKPVTMSEESELCIIEWDMKKGFPIPPHKQERYEELKKKYRK